MARGYRSRRYLRRTRRLTKRGRLIRRKMLLRKRIKAFVNRMGYPSYVKMIGMTESKRLVLRKTLSLFTPTSFNANNGDEFNTFQVVLNPLECPNISKAFVQTQLSYIPPGQQAAVNYPIDRLFKYDYIRIKNIFISIKPAQNISTTNGTVQNNNNDLYGENGTTPISNVYAYFTYRYPMTLPDNNVNGAPRDSAQNLIAMYGTNPLAERIKLEGKLKNVYTWPSNKPMTISLNKLYYRVNTEPFKLCSNCPLDLQYLSTLCTNNNGVYDPFGYRDNFGAIRAEPNPEMEELNDENNNIDDLEDREMAAPDGSDVPDLGMRDYNLFFGRLVIVSPKHVRFTTEICYDCVLIR